MTKKDAAAHVFYVAKLIREELEGDDQAEVWITSLEALARDLDPHNDRYRMAAAREPGVSTRVKLRRLIEHPATPAFEREAAIAALARLQGEGR